MFSCEKKYSCCNYQCANTLDELWVEGRDCPHLIEVGSVVHAHWYKDKNTNLYKCSNCHKYATYPCANSKVWEQYKSMYCPTCGAKMDGE